MRRGEEPADEATRALAYLRCSTREQADSRLGLDAQRAAVMVEAERRGWQLVDVLVDAGASGKSLAGRPALSDALSLLDRGHADALIVAKLDRLSRSVLDFAGVLARAERRGGH